MAEAARTTITLLYDGVDISADVSRDLISFTYTDNSAGTVDDLQIVLQDRFMLWRDAWFPEKGATLVATIVPAFGGGVLDCGTFEIDEIELGGSPNTATIKAVSTPVTAALRGEKRTKAWESTSLKEIAQAIAQRAGLESFYQAKEIKYQRVDQRDESDLAYLNRLCLESSLNLKVGSGQVVIYDEQEFEKRAPVSTIDVLGGQVTGYSFKSKTRTVYKKAEVSYRDPSANTVRKFTYTPSDVPKVGQTLKVRKRVESIGAARELAKRELRNANKGEVTGTFAVPGNPLLQAGQNVVVTGIGVLNATYHIEKAIHTVSYSGGYETAVDLHRVLAY